MSDLDMDGGDGGEGGGEQEAVLDESYERHHGINRGGSDEDDEEGGAMHEALPRVNYQELDNIDNNMNIQVPSEPPIKPPNVTTYYVESRRIEAIKENPAMSPTEIDQMLRAQYREGLGKADAQSVKREVKALKARFQRELQLYKNAHPEFDDKKWYGQESKSSNKRKSRGGRKSKDGGSDNDTGGAGSGYRRRRNEPKSFLMNSFDQDDSDDGYSRPPANKKRRKNGNNNNNSNSNDNEAEMSKSDSMDLFFASIVQGNKSRGKRKKKLDEGEMLTIDDNVQQQMRELCDDMRSAARKDWRCNENKMPAIHMTQMVQYVAQQLSKTFLQTQFLEDEHCYVLDCIRDWIHPLPDGSLPPVKVRTEMYRIIEKFELHKQQSCREYLERSNERSAAAMEDDDDDDDEDGMNSNSNSNSNSNRRSGRNSRSKEGFAETMMTLWAHKHETLENKRRLRVIILKLIHQLTQSLRDQEEEEDLDGKKEAVQRRNEILRKQQRNVALAALSGPRKRASIPERPGFDFAIKPKDQVIQTDDAKVPTNRRMQMEQRFRAMKSVSKNNQAIKPSLTGRRR